MHNRRKVHNKGTKGASSAQCVIEFANIVTLLTQKEANLTTNSNIVGKTNRPEALPIMHHSVTTIGATRVAYYVRSKNIRQFRSCTHVFYS